MVKKLNTSMLDNFSNFIKSDIKENLSVIILIPSVLGGIWQVLELLKIGLPYLRFFSLSQLISDGLAIAITILIFIILYRVANPKKFIQSLFDGNGDRIPTFLLVILIIFPLIAVVFYNDLYNDDNQFTFLDYINLSIPLLILIGAFIRLFFRIYLKIGIDGYAMKLIKYHIQNQTRIYENTKLFAGFVIQIVLLFAFVAIIKFRDLIYSSPNLDNIKLAKENVNKNLNKSTKTEILYFNDKYIFMEIQESDIKESKKIIIYKTDDIFFPKIKSD